jgi:hypothetical protein
MVFLLKRFPKIHLSIIYEASALCRIQMHDKKRPQEGVNPTAA